MEGENRDRKSWLLGPSSAGSCYGNPEETAVGGLPARSGGREVTLIDIGVSTQCAAIAGTPPHPTGLRRGRVPGVFQVFRSSPEPPQNNRTAIRGLRVFLTSP